VKQSDLGEYEENVREKKNIKGKNTSSPSNQVIWIATLSFNLKRVVSKTRGFSMQKTIPP
jgi:hypothetical protein